MAGRFSLSFFLFPTASQEEYRIMNLSLTWLETWTTNQRCEKEDAAVVQVSKPV